jgi:hypothetical protein
VEEISVKPTISEKKIVTHSRCSASTVRPACNASAMCWGKMSNKEILALLAGAAGVAVSASIRFTRISTSSNVGRISGLSSKHSFMRDSI